MVFGVNGQCAAVQAFVLVPGPAMTVQILGKPVLH